MQEAEIVMKRVLNEQIIEAYGAYLLREEKSGATVEKYLRDVRGLACCLAGGEVTKERIVAWKNWKTAGSQQHLADDEKALRGYRGEAHQGVSP